MKKKYLWITFAAALFITVPLRVYQLLFLMDSQGFYTDGDVISWILLAVLAVSSAILIGGSLSSPHLPKRFTQEKNYFRGAVQIALGAAAIVYSIVEIIRLGGGGGGLAGALLYVAIILAFFGVGAGVVWIVNGVSCILGKNLIRLAPLAGILPPLWMSIMLFTNAVQFSGSTVTLNNMEAIYDTLTLILMTLFVFNQSKMVAGAQGKKCGKRVYGYGLSMVLFGITSALPYFLSLITRGHNAGSYGLWMSLVIALLCLSAVVFLIILPKGRDAYEEELVEEPAEPEQPEKPQTAKTAEAGKTPEPGGKPEKQEKPKPEGTRFQRVILAILKAFAVIGKAFVSLGEKLSGLLFRRKRKVIPWTPGELEEQATQRMDETWRLDFYGFEPKDDSVPYKPEFYDLTEEEIAKQQQRRQEVEEMMRKEQEEKRSKKNRNDLRIPARRGKHLSK